MSTFNGMTNRIETKHFSYAAHVIEYQESMKSDNSQFENVQTVINRTRNLILNGIFETPTDEILVEAFNALCNRIIEIKPGLDYTNGVVMKLPQEVYASLVDREGTTSIHLRAGKNQWKFGFDRTDGPFNYCK
jgi:hypothetical protein